MKVLKPFFLILLVIIWEMTFLEVVSHGLESPNPITEGFYFPDPLLKPQWLWVCFCAVLVQD